MKNRRAPKRTFQLEKLPLAKDESVATKQRDFCKNLIEQMLSDESCLSFSKPVDELWDREVLADYFELITEPMDLGTILQTASSDKGYINEETGLFDANAFRYQARLVFLNALRYNEKGTDLARFATKFINFIDTKLADLPAPSPPSDDDHSQSPDLLDSTSKDRKKAKEENQPEKSDEEEEENGKVDDDMRDSSTDDTEIERLKSLIATLSKKKALSEATLAETELMRNVPLSFEENSKLRDEVESLPWEKAQKVANILDSYVQEALLECKEEDPEFVTLEFSTIEPQLLRDIEALIRPDPTVEKERKVNADLEEELSAVKRKLKSLEHSGRKKPRRRR